MKVYCLVFTIFVFGCSKNHENPEFVIERADCLALSRVLEGVAADLENGGDAKIAIEKLKALSRAKDGNTLNDALEKYITTKRVKEGSRNW